MIPTAKAIIDYVGSHPGATLAELESQFGPGGDIDIAMPGRPDLVLWTGVSQAFADAFDAAHHALEPNIDVLAYLWDGAMLSLPVVLEYRTDWKPYAKPHWLPLVFSLKGAGA